MIAQRFRPMGWVAGVAAAATMLYIVSLQVAAERGRLEMVERKIAMTKRDIRQLQTEIETRGSLRQLERWNGEALALSAPKASQFLSGEVALASLDADAAIGGPAVAPPRAMLAALPAAAEPAAPAGAAVPEAKLQHATYVKIDKADAPVARKVALVEPSLMGDLQRRAATEAKGDKPRP